MQHFNNNANVADCYKAESNRLSSKNDNFLHDIIFLPVGSRNKKATLPKSPCGSVRIFHKVQTNSKKLITPDLSSSNKAKIFLSNGVPSTSKYANNSAGRIKPIS